MNKAKKYKLKLDYTEEELKELRRLGMAYDGPIAAVYRLGEKESINDPFINLRAKYRILDIHKEFNFMADINNAVMGTAIFPENKYIVHDKVTDQYIYYIMTQNGLRWRSLETGIPEKKAKKEWLAISPAYEPMLEKVED